MLYSLVFVVAMLVEFAIIILISRRKQSKSEDSRGENTSKNEKTSSSHLITTKIVPVGDVNEQERQNVDSVKDKEIQNQGMGRIRKFISGVSAPHAIDFVAFWSFIFVFMWFNFDQLLPLLN